MNSIHVLLKESWDFKAYLKVFSLLLFIMVTGNVSVYGQCPNPGVTVIATNITCNGANDGTISITVDDPNGYTGDYTYNLAVFPAIGFPYLLNHTTTSTSHTFTNLPVGSYPGISVNIGDGSTCPQLLGMAQNLSEPTALTLSATTQADCDLTGIGSIDLEVQGGTTPIVRYTWTGGLTNDQQDHTGVSAGSYDVEVEDSNGCIATLTGIVVNPPPDATITPAGPFCVNAATVNLVAATPGGTWSGTGITDQTNGIFDPAAAGVGTHVITYEVDDGNGCVASDSENIVVNALPTVTITPAGPFCVDAAPVNLAGSPAGGTWSGVGIIDVANGTFDPAAAGTGTHQIVYEFMDSNGCVASDTEDIVVNGLPTVTITPAGPFCENAPAVNLVGTPTGGTWQGDGITDPANGTFDPAAAGAGTHLITYEFSDVNGCTASDTETIEVTALPTVTITPAGPFCVNETAVNLTGTPTGGTWIGTGITDGANGTFDPATAGVGTHNITYSVTDANGCSASTTEPIEVTALPTVTITPAGPFCEDAAAVNLTGTPTGGTWSGPGITDTANGTFDPAVAGDGTHEIIYEASGANGCTSSDTLDIVVNALPTVTITPAGPFCVNAAPVNLVGNPTGGMWSGPGITDAANGTFDPSVAGIGTFTIQYEVSDANGCFAIDTEDIDVTALPTVTITPAGPFCEDAAPVNLTGTPIGGTWIGPGITDGAAGTFDPAVAGDGAHVITYEVNDGGCVGTANENIVVNALPAVTINPAGPFCEDAAPVNLVGNPTGGTWIGTGITDGAAGTFDPAVAGAGLHVITYEVTDVNGCEGSATANINVNALPMVTITPAGPFCVNAAPVNLTGNPTGGTWIGPGITDGANGTFDPSVAGQGSHIITYEVTDGSGCTGSVTENIDVNPLPDAGTDVTTDVCQSNNAFDLFAALGGTPQAGGTWNDDDGSGGLTGSVFDATVAGVTAGNTYNFTYTVTGTGCTPATATVSVNIIAQPTAGTGSTGTACVSTTNFDLFTLLSGHDPGGIWNDTDLTLALSGPNNEIFDASAVPVGSYDFSYIVSSPVCGPRAAQVTVNVVANLNAGTALANIEACGNETAFNLFTGLTGHDNGGSWGDDDGTGALTGNLFDASAVTPGSYQFTYTIAAPGCTPDSETITVDVSAAPTADAGIDQSVCVNHTFLNASLGANETGIWAVIGGTGTFVDPTDPNTEVTGLAEGTNLLRWTVTDVNTNCTEVDVVTVDFTNLTLPNAGPDQNICTNSTTLAANNFDNLTEIGVWSYTGPVLPAPVFDDPNDPNTQVTGLIDGETYEFRWTIADINPFGCGGNDDIVMISVVGAITAANAGPDQNVCNTFTTLAANNAGTGESGTWTVVSGSGVFSDNNNPTAIVAGLSQGLNQFQWEITDNVGTCPSSVDVVDINVTILTTADAGPDQAICGTSANLAANTAGANETGFWTVVSGSGVFDDLNVPNTTVTGLSPGLNEFQWEIRDNASICPSIVDVVAINVTAITVANAGPDQNICTTSTTLAATAAGTDETGTWSVVSGTAVFDDSNDPFTGVNGLTVGTNVLRWTITDNNGICPPTQSDVTINIIGSITAANAGPDQSICVTATNLSANGTGANETGTWTVVNGTGVFTDPNNPNSAVTGLSLGVNEFQWTIAPTSGPCPPSTDIVSVEVGNTTAASAGPDQNICTTSTTLAANTVGTDETGTWSIVSGTAIFDNINNPVTDVNGLTVGTNVLRWTITDDNGICPPTQSDVTINIIGSITAANAGPDQTICAATATNLAANLTGANETGTWTVVNGTGVFGDPNDPNTPVTGLTAGVNEFQWTITPDSGPCPPSSDIVVVEVGSITAAAAGPDQNICTTGTTMAANAVDTDETGTWSVVSGTAVFDNINDPATDVSGLTVGTSVLRWTITDDTGTCPPTQSDVTINIIGNITTADAGPDQNICTTNTTLAANAVDTDETGEWSVVSGAAIFADQNSPVTSVGGLAVGANVLRWTITDNNGVCPATQSEVTINVVGSITTANAGPDQFICDTFTTLAGNNPGSVNEEGTWIVVDGSGNFVDDNDPLTSVTGLSTGINRFVWSIDDLTGPCPSSTDTVIVEVGANTIANAGPDQSICTTSTFLAANGFGGNEQGMWSVVTGTAVFVDASDPNTEVNGLMVGTNVLRWTITDTNGVCPSTQDDVTIDIIGSITAANAGPDQNICDTFTILAANAFGINESGTWTVTEGSGVFADAGDPASNVTGLSTGTNRFVWTIQALTGPCPPSTDTVTVEVGANTPADAGPDQNICTTSTTLAADPVGGNESGAWSVVSGSATFDDMSVHNTNVSGLTVGTNVLRWTITDNNGVCPPRQSDVTINIIGSITAADAGPDQNICTTITSLSGNTFGANENGTWTVTEGSGAFDDAGDPATDVSGLSTGTNKFVWTIEALTGPCPPSTDTVTVEVGLNTPADAGPDQNICTTSTTLAANAVTGNESGAWSVVTGSALFDDINVHNTPVNGLTVGMNVLRWTITDANGACPPRQADVTINIIGSITAADAGPDQDICDSFTTLSGNAFGTNENGTWTVTEGTGVFGDAGNPLTSVSGLSTGTNRFVWTIEALTGPCPPSTDTVTVEVDAITVANAGPDQNICTTSTTLAADAAGTGETGTWTVVSGTGNFNNINAQNTQVTGLSIGNNVFRWTISKSGTCPDTQDDVTINRIDPADPICAGGGGVNCGAFVISVTEMRPTCTGNDDGIISFNITGGSGNYTVLLTNNGSFNKGETGTTANAIEFQDLSADDYEYTVDDGSGNVCSLPYSLVRQTTIEASGTDFEDVICFGAATGEATVTVTQGGNAPYEYSIDGLVWNALPPNGVINNLPPLGAFNVLVRNDVTDQCPAEVPVVINNAFPEINLTFNTTDATCDNAGGSIEVLNVTGGLAPYRYRLDGVDFATLPASNNFEDLTAGFHFLTVIDDNNCQRNYNILVNAPGLVLFNSSVINPDCSSNGQNGSITIQIDPSQLPGSFEAAISTEIDEDGEFQFVPTNGIMEFANLSVGTYYVTVVAAGGCPNKVPITISNGPVALDFDMEVECFDNRQAVFLSNITVEDNTPFNIEVYRIGEITPIDVITLPNLPAGNVYRITSANFLNAVGNYQLLLTQEQVVCGTSLSSGVENFSINRPLAATLGEITQSLPEQPTGTIMINNVTGGAGGYRILIEPSGGIWIDVPLNQTNQEFEYQFTELSPGAYEVFISDSLGCEIMFSPEVPRDTEIFIPNIFTPNGDNFNETFFIRNLPLDGTQLHISNRLGRKVYETDNYQNDWDGEDNVDGIYYYTIQIGDEKFSGWVEIWRGGANR